MLPINHNYLKKKTLVRLNKYFKYSSLPDQLQKLSFELNIPSGKINIHGGKIFLVQLNTVKLGLIRAESRTGSKAGSMAGS